MPNAILVIVVSSKPSPRASHAAITLLNLFRSDEQYKLANNSIDPCQNVARGLQAGSRKTEQEEEAAVKRVNRLPLSIKQAALSVGGLLGNRTTHCLNCNWQT
ncbi:hypothetical protein [Ralstonia sp. SET104]|uniref:hypothetical protein n=1 Tax=Ralstonia sp. SET104 TaxID=2448774 RepID=UPI000F55BCA7|nr:hypothetical protein [Ralstonia sp. SET104]